MIYGYIRVSTDKQDCENQKIGIEQKAESLGIKIDKYIMDSGVSGIREPDKRALGGCLMDLIPGDVIICSELSRLGRSLMQIMEILNFCMERDVRVMSVKENYEFGDDINSKVLAFAFGLSAEIERKLISQRTKEALYMRRSKGIVLGRPKGSKSAFLKLSARSKELRLCLESGISKVEISRRFSVSRSTLNLYLRNNHCAA